MRPEINFARNKQNILRKRLALSGIILGLFLIAALIAVPHLHFEPAVSPPTNPAPMDASPSLGPENAPITIIEYADFGCPSCWAWYKLGVLEELRAKYGDQIRFVWRDFPVITLRSPDAAEAGQCAHEQGKFWEFHDLVYEHDGAIEADDLKAYAAELGLNMEQFTECTTSHRYQDRVNAEQHEAFQLGIIGTPTFFVNNKPVVGPQRIAVFVDLIDPLLASKK